MILSQDRIDSQNQFNAAANVAQDQLRRVLVDWVGRKAWKVSGSGGAVAKLAAAVAGLSDAAGWNQQGAPFVCLVCRHGCLSAFFRGAFAGRQLSTDIELGRVDDSGTLAKLYGRQPRRTDYTVEEIRATTERAYELEREARQLRRSVSEFYNF